MLHNIGIILILRLMSIFTKIKGVVYSSNHAVMSRWAPILERSKMVALSTSGMSGGQC